MSFVRMTALLLVFASATAMSQEQTNLRALGEYGAMLGLNEACRAREVGDQRAAIERFLASKVALMEHMLASKRVPQTHNVELQRVLEKTRRREIDRNAYAVVRETGFRLSPEVLADACKGIVNQVETGLAMDEIARRLFDDTTPLAALEGKE